MTIRGTCDGGPCLEALGQRINLDFIANLLEVLVKDAGVDTTVTAIFARNIAPDSDEPA
jgi:hypothetical protein